MRTLSLWYRRAWTFHFVLLDQTLRCWEGGSGVAAPHVYSPPSILRLGARASPSSLLGYEEGFPCTWQAGGPAGALFLEESR